MAKTLEEKILIGDMVNWECNGSLQFKELKKVEEIIPYEGTFYARLKGEKTGFPVYQLIKYNGT